MVLRGFGTGGGEGDAGVVEEDVEVGFFGLEGLGGLFDGGEVGEFEMEVLERAWCGGFVVVLCGLDDV